MANIIFTDDIYGEWSEPIIIKQGGIDPSLLFDDGHAYFISNGADDNGVEGVTQCEINIETGEKLSASKNIWCGSGGRDESSLFCRESTKSRNICRGAFSIQKVTSAWERI